jgi:hypothetical protein
MLTGGAATFDVEESSGKGSKGLRLGDAPDSSDGATNGASEKRGDGGGGAGAAAVVFATLDDPDSSALAKAIGTAIMLLIFVGSVSFVIESLPEVRASPTAKSINQIIEIFCVVAFTIDYLGRVSTCTTRHGPDRGILSYLLQPMNIIDFASIAPFYVEKFLNSTGGSLTILRMLRMARVFRVFKVGSMASDLRVFGRGMQKASAGLSLLAFMLVIYLILFAAFLQMIEGPAHRDADKAGFESIPATFWYVLATLTTVGYGDVFPLTPVGKVVGGACMLCGILVLALPIVLIGRWLCLSYGLYCLVC